MRKLFLVLISLSILVACKKDLDNAATTTEATSTALPGSYRAGTTVTENFESGTKTSYTTAAVVLGSGTWTLNDALLGTSASDKKTGVQSARLRNSGKLTMGFDKAGGAGTVTVAHAAYGTDASSTWQLWYSTNAGSTYTQTGATQTSVAGNLVTATFTINVSGAVRIEIRKTDGSTNRLNIDDVVINDYAGSNPAPTLSSISPASATAGGAAFTLTATGSSFINGSQIAWNGTPLTTTNVSATQLTAGISASLITTSGTASVTVVTPAPGGGTSSAFTFTINAAPVVTTKKYLFDARHAETAGNADWVIDEDNSTPQRTPTPTQANITSTTSETYWTGAISAWGIALVKQGHFVETLPSSGSITYGNSANAQDLSNYSVFVVDEPNTVFSASEKTAILQFVQNGGGLIMVSDHTISDRNNDGWDSPMIWNDLMTNNSVQSNPFGFSIDYTDISTTSSNIAAAGTSPVLSGVAGSVTSIQFNNGATITINPAVNANVKGLAWASGATQNNSNLLCATSTFGSGRVFVLGDSSPTDDGTGAPSNVLFNGWGVYSHAKLLVNASLWVAKVQ